MMREQIIQTVLDKKVIAIVRGVYGQDCLNLAKALHRGGIDLLEVTFDQSNPALWERTADTIRLLVQELGQDMTFGAGTVTSTGLVAIAKQAGANFIVSPNTNRYKNTAAGKPCGSYYFAYTLSRFSTISASISLS